MSRLLTALEVARELGITRYRTYELARLGILPSVRLGRSIRFPREALEAGLAAETEKPRSWKLEAGTL